ncbi:hypothetical protein H6G41_12520 [Tolypothrix sp. FACHB-123]|uniref:hypothetical protein n=1 Tax=Tolypothrix sp. FACHB-123 TaxID=2692868 RepID=UPI0016859CC5|nr:hypothetical protein [Tolypothrix sp. FACHB-123]MBD2355429.1 hypothetical protein [Tolypothrix sp. FACHB-123]
MSTPPRNLKFKISCGFAVVLCTTRIPTFNPGEGRLKRTSAGIEIAIAQNNQAARANCDSDFICLQ